MNTIDRLNIFSFAKFQAVLTGLLGLVAGACYSIGGLIFDLVTTGTLNWGTALAFFALIGMPLIFAAVGFCAGLVEAFLYNIMAARWGGMALKFWT